MTKKMIIKKGEKYLVAWAAKMSIGYDIQIKEWKTADKDMRIDDFRPFPKSPYGKDEICYPFIYAINDKDEYQERFPCLDDDYYRNVYLEHSTDSSDIPFIQEFHKTV